MFESLYEIMGLNDLSAITNMAEFLPAFFKWLTALIFLISIINIIFATARSLIRGASL